MNKNPTVVFAITVCLLVAASADQGLMDCRKLVYSRNCRGVAVKRGDLENGQTRSENLRNGLSLKRLLHDLGSSTGYPLTEDGSTADRFEARGENGFQKDKQRLDRLLFELFSGNSNRKNSENEYLLSYEY